MFTVMLMEGSLHTQQGYTNGPTNTLTTTPNGHGVLEPTKTKLSDVVGTKVGTLVSFRDRRDPVTGEVAFDDASWTSRLHPTSGFAYIRNGFKLTKDEATEV